MELHRRDPGLVAVGIVADDIARVRAATDFVAVAGEHLALKRVGRRYVGLCPFHAEKSGSFSVNAEEGLYHCFGCGAGGDVITFVMAVEHMGFAEAVERLAARSGLAVHYDDAAVSVERARRGALVKVMEHAVAWYHERLLSSPDAAAARSYLRGRGFDGEMVRRFSIGWAPDSWDALCRALHSDDETLHETGLGRRNSIGRLNDTFRSRVMFPIFDVRGEPVAFGGRHLDGGPPPKYKNSPETSLYAKSRVLYGLNWAKSAIVERGEVVVCEGYTDVMGLAQVGLAHAVATCGTALTDEHFRVLKNFARRVVLAYDADAAGQAAAARFYEWEQRYEMDIAVAELPSGTDPGQLASTDPDALVAAITMARPFLAFRLQRTLAGADLRSAEGRAKAARAAMEVVGQHPNDLVRDQYVMEIADRVHIDAARLRSLRLDVPPPREAGRPTGSTAKSEPGGPDLEVLRAVVADRASVASRVHDALFGDPTVAAAFVALRGNLSVAAAIDSAPDPAAALLRRLAVEDIEVDVDDALARLVEQAVRRVLKEIDAASRRSSDPLAFNAEVAWLQLAVAELREPDTAPSATTRLVRWLVDRYETGQ